ncbi:hypothetical protein DITRI_Ditri20bG0035400 [Diplodiscus trichospermus]
MESKMVSKNYILLVGMLKEYNMRCGFGTIYAPNIDSDRQVLWVELTDIVSNSGVPWCLGGDFNVVKIPEEKVGLGYNLLWKSG